VNLVWIDAEEIEKENKNNNSSHSNSISLEKKEASKLKQVD
jgi:hypothetical protein